MLLVVRILLAAVLPASVPSPLISRVSPNCLLITLPVLPWNFNPFVVASLTAFAMLASNVCFKSNTLTPAFGFVVLAVFNLSKYSAVAVVLPSPVAPVGSITEATLLNTTASVVSVLPVAGFVFTRRACGLSTGCGVTPPLSAAFLTEPSAFTSVAL